MGFLLGSFLFMVLEAGFCSFVMLTGKGASKENQVFKYLMYSLSVFCCWMMWALMYMAQMTPMMNPILQG